MQARNTSLALKVQEIYSEDRGYGYCHIDKHCMDLLGATESDVLEVKGNNSRTVTRCRLFSKKIKYLTDPAPAAGLISLDRIARINAAVDIGDIVYVRKLKTVPAGEIFLAAVSLTRMPDPLEKSLIDRFKGIPVIEGDDIYWYASNDKAVFRITHIEASGYDLNKGDVAFIVSENSKFRLDESSANLKLEEKTDRESKRKLTLPLGSAEKEMDNTALAMMTVSISSEVLLTGRELENQDVPSGYREKIRLLLDRRAVHMVDDMLDRCQILKNLLDRSPVTLEYSTRATTLDFVSIEDLRTLLSILEDSSADKTIAKRLNIVPQNFRSIKGVCSAVEEYAIVLNYLGSYYQLKVRKSYPLLLTNAALWVGITSDGKSIGEEVAKRPLPGEIKFDIIANKSKALAEALDNTLERLKSSTGNQNLTTEEGPEFTVRELTKDKDPVTVLSILSSTQPDGQILVYPVDNYNSSSRRQELIFGIGKANISYRNNHFLAKLEFTAEAPVGIIIVQGWYPSMYENVDTASTTIDPIVIRSDLLEHQHLLKEAIELVDSGKPGPISDIGSHPFAQAGIYTNLLTFEQAKAITDAVPFVKSSLAEGGFISCWALLAINDKMYYVSLWVAGR